MSADAPTHEPADALALMGRAAADDFALLAALHDREPMAALLERLRAIPARDWFGLPPSAAATAGLDAALADLPAPLDEARLDRLAAEYADVYLVNTYDASPMESFWLDEEHLAWQQSMFDVRDWQKHYGLKAENWRDRSNDHLVLELVFLGHLCGLGTETALRDAARFLDRHLLLWIKDFAARVSQRCPEPWYGALAAVTADYAESLRVLLEETLQEPRWRPAPKKTAKAAPDLCSLKEAAAARFVPGTAPSW